ncbi:MAG: hypothetical protein H5U37_03255 [Caldisericia bacterium]|nr:hypothetical protein [Caldisericia bacterium]
MKKILVSLLILGLIGVIGYLIFNHNIEKREEEKEYDVPFLTMSEIRDPQISLKYGIVGYIEISLPNDSPLINSENISIRKGDKIEIPLLIHFVSYTPDLKKVEVFFDPINEVNGQEMKIEQCYVKTDDKGNIIDRGEVLINKLISYIPNYLIINNNEFLKVTMIVKIPKDIPPIQEFKLFPLGIYPNHDHVFVIFNENYNLNWEVIIND